MIMTDCKLSTEYRIYNIFRQAIHGTFLVIFSEEITSVGANNRPSRVRVLQ